MDAGRATRQMRRHQSAVVLNWRKKRWDCETYLYDGTLARNLEHLALSGLSVSELDVDDLGVPGRSNTRQWEAGVLTWGT